MAHVLKFILWILTGAAMIWCMQAGSVIATIIVGCTFFAVWMTEVEGPDSFTTLIDWLLRRR
jgi:hypothetical protein